MCDTWNLVLDIEYVFVSLSLSLSDTHTHKHTHMQSLSVSREWDRLHYITTQSRPATAVATCGVTIATGGEDGRINIIHPENSAPLRTIGTLSERGVLISEDGTTFNGFGTCVYTSKRGVLISEGVYTLSTGFNGVGTLKMCPYYNDFGGCFITICSSPLPHASKVYIQYILSTR